MQSQQNFAVCKSGKDAAICCNIAKCSTCMCDTNNSCVHTLLSDVDECVVAALEQRAICPHSAYCENTPGYYECTCPGDTLLKDGACIQRKHRTCMWFSNPILLFPKNCVICLLLLTVMADTTTPAQTTAVEPNTVPVPVTPILSTSLYVIIAGISAGSILVGLIVIMVTLKCM